jgi:hypothetical protein
MAFLDFELSDVEESTSNFDPVPDNWYTAKIASAEVKDTKAGTGKYIAVRFDITGPSHEGRVVFCNFNTNNPNPKAEEIGRQQLKQCAVAIGQANLKNTDQLIGGDLEIKVTVKNDPTYGPSNEIKGFKAINGGSKPMPSNSVTKPATESSSPPWAQ